MNKLKAKIKKAWIIPPLALAVLWFFSPLGQQTLSRTDKIIQSREKLFLPVTGAPKFDPEVHSDGCSGGMSEVYSHMTHLHSLYGTQLPWRECCVVHDKAYYYGGSKEQKERADKELKSCVSSVVGEDVSGQLLAEMMEDAVMIGGQPFFPTSYRWGYGADHIESHPLSHSK